MAFGFGLIKRLFTGSIPAAEPGVDRMARAAPDRVKIEGQPVTVKVGPFMDSDFASLEAAETRIKRIEGHLADRARLGPGMDQTENCDQCREKLKRLRAFVAAMKVEG